MNGLTAAEPSGSERQVSEEGGEQATQRARRLALLRPWLMVAGSVVMAGLGLLALNILSRELDYAAITGALAQQRPAMLLAAVLATAVSYGAMVGYDLASLNYVARGAVPPRIAALAAFCAFALSNTVGVGTFTGGAVRWRIYAAAGLDPARIARVIVVVTASFVLGLFAVAALGLLLEAEQMAGWFSLPAPVLRLLALAALGLMLGLALLGRLRRGIRVGRFALRVPPMRLILFQGLVSLVDIGAAATVLWLLLPEGAVDLPSFMALYAVAIAIGAASHLPGGIGVFEAVVLLAFRNSGVPLDGVAAALVLYRAIYYALPLAVAILLLAGFEASRRAHLLARGTRAVRAATRLMPRFLGTASFAAGAALLLGGVTPPLSSNEPGLLAPALPLPLFELSHLLASVGGLALIFVAHGLVHRLDGAWWLALVLSTAGLVLSIARGGSFLEISLLVLLGAALLASRGRFDRRARLLTPSLTPGWWLAVAGVVAAATWLLFFAHRDVDYSRQLWWQFELDASAPRGMRATLGVVLALFAAGLWTLLRPARTRVHPPTAGELAQAIAITEKQDRADANLVRMGDKALLFSEQGDAFIMYGRRGRSWIALFDPVGAREQRVDMVWRFVEMADAQHGRAAFYQVRPENLPLYIDAGLRPLKLGEAARVRLSNFDLKGRSRQVLRSALNRAEREGLTFAVIPPAEVPALLPELSEVSRQWLEQHRTREKAFSLGAFEPGYVSALPVAVVRDPGGAIIAFATLLETPATRREMSIDLMRHRPVVPPGTMDFLFLRLILRAKELDYEFFDLGMAPLSGLAAHRLAPVWYRLGGLVFRRGERFYNFRGLRAFKEKFDPEWEPRYLCTPGGLDPWVVLADVAALQSGGLRGVIGK